MRNPRPAVLGGLLAVLVLAGCSDTNAARPAPRPHAAPVSAGKCNDLVGSTGDVSVLAGFDWSGEKHEFTDLVTVYVCTAPSSGGAIVYLHSLPAGVTTDQDEQIFPESENETPTGTGVVPFQIRVAPGAGGALQAAVDVTSGKDRSRMVGMGGPRIVSDATGWRFIRSEYDP